METREHRGQRNTIALPAPTSSPIVLALGVTFLFFGIVTSPSISILGAVFCVFGIVG